MTSPHIRPMTPYDYYQWCGLYKGYADFYHVALIKDGVQTICSWLIATGQVCTGLVADQQGQLVGFTYFRGMPSSLRGQMVGSLDDLFVVPDHRSGGTAAALIKAVQAEARGQDWGIVRCITRVYDYRARGLYNKLTEKTDRMLYGSTEVAAK